MEYQNGKVATYNYDNNILKSIDYNNGNKTVFEYKGDKIDKELKYLKNGVCKEIVQYNYFFDGRIVKEEKGPNDDGFNWSICDPLEETSVTCKIKEEFFSPYIMESIVEFVLDNFKKINSINFLWDNRIFFVDDWTFRRINYDTIEKLEKEYNITIIVHKIMESCKLKKSEIQ